MAFLEWLVKRTWYIAALGSWVLAYLSFRFGVPLFDEKTLTYEQHGQVGDLFGAFTCMFSIVAALQSIETNKSQTLELKDQRNRARRERAAEDFNASLKFEEGIRLAIVEITDHLDCVERKDPKALDFERFPVVPQSPFVVEFQLNSSCVLVEEAMADVVAMYANFVRYRNGLSAPPEALDGLERAIANANVCLEGLVVARRNLRSFFVQAES